MAKIPRVPVKNQITTLSVVKIVTKFSPYARSSLKKFENETWPKAGYLPLHGYKLVRLTYEFFRFSLHRKVLKFFSTQTFDSECTCHICLKMSRIFHGLCVKWSGFSGARSRFANVGTLFGIV